MSEELGLERTRAFEVGGRDFAVPDLTALGPVSELSEPVASDITATYFDTADLRLVAQRISLRRVSSNGDVGWDLHVTDEDGAAARTEADPPDDDGMAVPGALAELLRGSVRDRELAPVAAIRTLRTERCLLDADGRELARVGDDLVHGQRFTTGQAELTHWREIELELVDGDLELLSALSTSLREAGLTPSAPSRLHRALGHVDEPVIDLRDRAVDGSVGELVTARLRDEVARLIETDRSVRRGRAGAVQDMRLAIRRLRCDLATWRPFLDGDRTEELRRELRWMGGVLGRLRDAEMLEARLVRTVRDLPADMIVGPVAERIENELRGRRSASAERVAATFEGVRYFSLVDRLEAYAGDPPLTGRASDPADEALAHRVAHALARVDRTVQALEAPGDPEVRADRMHEVRKAARRASYAAESIEPQLGRRARRLAARMADLQDALGEHHDSVVARQALHEIGAAAHVAGESAFTYGILHGIERDRGEAAEAAFETTRRQLQSSEANGKATA